MDILPLYRYTDEEGRVIDSLTPPDGEYTARVRLIAEEGKLLSKSGSDPCPCIDDDGVYGWTEIDVPEGYMQDADSEPVEDSDETEEVTDDGV